MRKQRGAAGFTLVEVVIAMVVFSLIALSVAQAIFFFSTQGTRTREKGFATQKAIQMLEELRSAVSASGSVAVLDNYNDGVSNNFVLTTNLGVTNPADPSSGNGAGQLYRRVTVAPMPNDPSARQVYVRVYDAATNVALAQTMSVLRTVPNKFYPSQVYDVYFIAANNVPGWWVLTTKLKPILDSVVQNLQSVNPGLVLRSHWITQLAYGRDPYYSPWINTSAWGVAESAAIPYVYLYPGWTTNAGIGGQEYYFDPTQMYGQLITDGNTTPNLNPTSYNYADEFDHGMRYQDEINAYNAAVASATASGAPVPEVSLRMLLDQMNTTTSTSPVKNLLLMNLHGEMLPLPPIRNYSDAAKDPANFPGQRAVTHPQWLQYGHNGTVKLRVYSYMTPEYVDKTSTGVVISTISVFFPQASITPANISVRELFWGTTYYTWGGATYTAGDVCTCVSNICAPTNAGDSYCVKQTTSTTEVVLVNSPVRQSTTTVSSGLKTTMRLYGMEYVPSPPQNMVSGQDFFEGVNDLTDTTAADAKNTARWVIQVATGALSDGMYQIQTRIGADLTTGPSSTNTNEWSNLSNTYVWLASTPPVTEQYQFMGDPRYEPYADAKARHAYNWDFVDISTNTNGGGYAYQGYYNTNSGYGGGNGWNGQVSYDAPRFYQLYRNGLLNAGGLWTTMTGWSFYYAAIGGDFGDDGNLGYTNPGIPINKRPWSPGNTGAVNVNEIVNDTGYTYYNAKLIAAATNYWVANPWQGELYPDAAFTGATGWAAVGNLPTGATTTSGYYRADYTTTFGPTNNTYSYGWKPEKRVTTIGAPSFLNAYPAGAARGSSNFYHDSASDTCPITSTGTAISTTFNYALLPSLTASRPWHLNQTGNNPPQWSNPYYSTQYTSSSIVAVTYSDSSNANDTASGLVEISSGSSQGAYLAVNGVPTQTSFGSNDIAQLSIVTMLYGFLQAGPATGVLNPTAVGAIHQVPLVAITTPTVTQQFLNPSTISIGWNISWSRWGSLPYTTSYPNTFSDPNITMNYNVKYSADNGKTWKFVSDGSPAVFGAYNAAYDASSPVVWNVTGFPQGTYLMDVEGFRAGYPIHYTYQEQSVYIQQ